MIVLTDSMRFAREVLPEAAGWNTPRLDPPFAALAGRLSRGAWQGGEVPRPDSWGVLFLVEHAPHSQFDVLVEVSREADRTLDRTVCLAGAGAGFHGFRNRPWSAPAGNVYLSTFIVPPPDLPHPEAAFIALAAVSVVDAIDELPGLAGRAGIKWVNDVLIGGAKVCGVLTHMSREGTRLTGVVLGIGLNVEATPAIDATPYVPRAAALNDVAPRRDRVSRRAAVHALLGALDRNLGALARDGARGLLDRYRGRSLVLGREAVVCSDRSGAVPDVIARGRVLALGDDLALQLEGVAAPVRNGRLILDGEPLLAGSASDGPT